MFDFHSLKYYDHYLNFQIFTLSSPPSLMNVKQLLGNYTPLTSLVPGKISCWKLYMETVFVFSEIPFSSKLFPPFHVCTVHKDERNKKFHSYNHFCKMFHLCNFCPIWRLFRILILEVLQIQKPFCTLSLDVCMTSTFAAFSTLYLEAFKDWWVNKSQNQLSLIFLRKTDTSLPRSC